MSSLEVPECANKLVRELPEVNRCVERHGISPVWLPGFRSAALHSRFLTALNSRPRSADTRLEGAKNKKTSKPSSQQSVSASLSGQKSTFFSFKYALLF